MLNILTKNAKIKSYNILLMNGVLCYELSFSSPSFQPGDKCGMLINLGNESQFKEIENLLKACEVENIKDLPGRIISIVSDKNNIHSVLDPIDHKLIIKVK